jgi:hypothetical protein
LFRWFGAQRKLKLQSELEMNWKQLQKSFGLSRRRVEAEDSRKSVEVRLVTSAATYSETSSSRTLSQLLRQADRRQHA